MHCVLEARGVSFAVLEEVHFRLVPGIYGLVGANGAGKTTLLRLLAGELTPTRGSVRVTGTVAYVAQEDDATIPRSAGERRRTAIERALAAQPDVLLLDEPTNHLDDAGRMRVLTALGRFRGIAVVVSHDRALLETVPRAILRVHEGRVRMHDGVYSDAARAWEMQRAEEISAHERARREVRTLERRLVAVRERHASAERSTSSRARMKNARDHDARGSLAKGKAAMGEASAGRLVSVARGELERAKNAVPRIDRDRTLGAHVFATYERAPMPVLFHAGGLKIGRGDRVRIAGPNGAGKTTLLRELLASARPNVVDRTLYLPQELRDVADLTAFDSETRGRILSLFAALGSDPERIARRNGRDGTFSPGEARKLALACGLGRHAWALVLDEPTNHFDLPTTERLERALADYPGAIVLVTHDDAFASAIGAYVVSPTGHATPVPPRPQ